MPAAWAMMLGGFGLAVYSLRSWRRASVRIARQAFGVLHADASSMRYRALHVAER